MDFASPKHSITLDALLRRAPAAGRAKFRLGLLEEVIGRVELRRHSGGEFLSHLGETVVRRNEIETGTWWFLGDVHGDYFALHTIMARILIEDPDANICFIGDIVDRGLDDAECLALIYLAGLERPGKTLWIVGNHDEALSIDESNPSAKFRSGVEPSEFADWLNHSTDYSSGLRVRLGRSLVGLAKDLPRAVLFADGLLAVHGGFPLSDLWPSLNSFEDLKSPRCLQDFVWTRLADKPKVLLNRNHKGCSYGASDLAGFAKQVEAFFPVKSMVRGHDHVRPGHEHPTRFESIKVLTVNTFAFDYLSNGMESSGYRDRLVAARHRTGDAGPRVEEIVWNWTDRLPFERERVCERLLKGPPRDLSDSGKEAWWASSSDQCLRLAQRIARAERASFSSSERELTSRYWLAVSSRMRAAGGRRRRARSASVDAQGGSEVPASPPELRLLVQVPAGRVSHLRKDIESIVEGIAGRRQHKCVIQFQTGIDALTPASPPLLSATGRLLLGADLVASFQYANGEWSIRDHLGARQATKDPLMMARWVRARLSIKERLLLGVRFQGPLPRRVRRCDLRAEVRGCTKQIVLRDLVRLVENGSPDDAQGARKWCLSVSNACVRMAAWESSVSEDEQNIDLGRAWRMQAREWQRLSSLADEDLTHLLAMQQERVQHPEAPGLLPPLHCVVHGSIIAKGGVPSWMRALLLEFHNALSEGPHLDSNFRIVAPAFAYGEAPMQPPDEGARLDLVVAADNGLTLGIRAQFGEAQVGDAPVRNTDPMGRRALVADLRARLGLDAMTGVDSSWQELPSNH